MKTVWILNGPNLNRLGVREPEIYGKHSLAEVEKLTNEKATSLGFDVKWFQSSSEGELVDTVHAAHDQNIAAIVINPGAYSHTSVALLDALKSYKGEIVEVHLSNTHHRESFRQVKLTAKASTIIMEGLGIDAYHTALYVLFHRGVK